MERLWFGTKRHFQWVPMPASGVRRRLRGTFEGGTLAQGGGYGYRSTAQHVEFEFSFPYREAHGLDGLDVFAEYASGKWDEYARSVSGFNPNDLMYFADPMASNLFSPYFSDPMLGLGDWPQIGDYIEHTVTEPSFYRQPRLTSTFAVTHAPATLPTQPARRFLIPIPPGYVLRWGWSGSRSGAGVVRAEAHHRHGVSTLVQDAQPLSVDGVTRVIDTVDGDHYDYVEFGLARTSAEESTVSVTSMMAVLTPAGRSEPVAGNHVSGQGATGCIFMGEDVLPEDWHLADGPGNRHLKGLAFGLKEIGAWL